MAETKQLIQRIKLATQLLQEHERTNYTQQDIVDRLEWVDHQISPSFFNRVLKWGEGTSKSLQKIKNGLDIIVASELLYHYDDDCNKYIEINDTSLIPRKITKAGLALESQSLRVYPEGRLSLEEKVDFFTSATEEVIFFGVRLKQFATYFTGRKEMDFKQHITKLLKRGIHVKCYMLDPEWSSSMDYFEDRASILEREQRSIAEMNLIKADLIDVIKEYQSQELLGTLQIFTYRHFPQGYYLVVDGERERGKMHFASYLFGLPRSESPVQIIHKENQPILFYKYFKSLVYLVELAEPLS